MEENLEIGHPLHGPHRPMGDMPPGFVGLRLSMFPEGPSVEARRPQVIVGRHSDADIRLPAPDISRRHCRLYFHEGYWRVQDLHSLNGVFVNDEKLHEGTLYDGDVLRLGEFVFRASYLPAPLGAQQTEVIQSIVDVLPRKAS